MKRFFALLTVLALLIPTAAAFGETAPDLYDLYSPAEEGRQWVGTAVPILEGAVMASPAALPETTSALEVWDGKEYRTISAVLPTAGGRMLVMLYETDGETPGIPEYSFAEAGRVLEAGKLVVRSGDWMKSRINRAVYDVAAFTWQNRSCLLMTLSGDTVLGAPVLTEDGKLAGIIVAEYTDAPNRYIALGIQEITACILEASDLLNSQETDNRPEGYSVTAENNQVTFDWSRTELPEAGEGENLYHIVADADSTYLTYTQVTPGMTSQTMLLTPGRMYISGLIVSAGIPDLLPEQYALTSLPEAEKMTDYGFRSLTLAIAEMPADGETGRMPVPAESVTEALLRSGRACILSASSYDVPDVQEGYTLLIALTAPDGNNYRYESGWYFDPQIQEQDEWYTPLQETGLLELLNQNGYPDGTYEMAMYIDGKLADSFSFELVR